MDIYGNFIDLGLVIYPIKEINKVISDKEISLKKDKDFIYIIKVEFNIVTDRVIIVGIKTPLNIISITSRDKNESIYNELSG